MSHIINAAVRSVTGFAVFVRRYHSRLITIRTNYLALLQKRAKPLSTIFEHVAETPLTGLNIAASCLFILLVFILFQPYTPLPDCHDAKVQQRAYSMVQDELHQLELLTFNEPLRLSNFQIADAHRDQVVCQFNAHLFSNEVVMYGSVKPVPGLRTEFDFVVHSNVQRLTVINPAGS